jgi:HEAT repeat protein
MNIRILTVLLTLSFLLTGCGLFGDKKDEKKPPPEKPKTQPVSDWDKRIGPTGIEAHGDRIGAASIDTLAMGGPASSPKIADYLADPSPIVRKKAVETLAKFGKDAEPALPKILEFLHNVDHNIRIAAAKCLAFIGHKAAIEPLERACKDTHPMVRIWAHAGLAKLEGDCEDHAEDVAELLKSGPPPVPGTAAEALGLMRCANEDVLEILIKYLGSGDEHVTSAAARSLGHFGPAASRAVPALMPLLEDKSWRVRQSALLSLARMGPKAAPAIPLLIEILKDPSPRFRELAAHTLGSIGPLAQSAVDPLKKLTLDQEATVQASAKRALAKILKE